MPWASRTVLEAKREFVALAHSPNANIRAVCRQFNVSPTTAYQLLRRFRAVGEQGLQDRSRRPLHGPLKTPKLLEEAAISVRAAHPLWGGRRIAGELRTQGLTKVPAASTITNILAQHGLLYQDKRVDRFEGLFTGHQDELTSLWTVQPIDESDLAIVREHLRSERARERRRAITMLAIWRGLRPSFICRLLHLSRATDRRCVRIFRERGAAALFDRRKNVHCKYANEVIKSTLFDVLHQPPSNFGINRTTWKMADLSRVLSEKGHPAGEDVIRKITKAAGHRWRRARTVLTSSDPEFSQKLDRIKTLLSNLGHDEAFFSIDEYDPFAVSSAGSVAFSSRRAAAGRAVAEVPRLDNSHRRNRTLFQSGHPLLLFQEKYRRDDAHDG